jgi:hypothetical protein
MVPVDVERVGSVAGRYTPLESANISPANCHIYVVEPRGFEPLTSAVQRRRSESGNSRGAIYLLRL